MEWVRRRGECRGNDGGVRMTTALCAREVPTSPSQSWWRELGATLPPWSAPRAIAFIDVRSRYGRMDWKRLLAVGEPNSRSGRIVVRRCRAAGCLCPPVGARRSHRQHVRTNLQRGVRVSHGKRVSRAENSVVGQHRLLQLCAWERRCESERSTEPCSVHRGRRTVGGGARSTSPERCVDTRKGAGGILGGCRGAIGNRL